MQRVREVYAIDEQHQVHTVAVYKHASGPLAYRLDDREMIEPLEEKWFLTQAAVSDTDTDAASERVLRGLPGLNEVQLHADTLRP